MLYLHIIAGGLGLVVGLLALIFRKGSRNHIRSGNIFFYAMLVATISAIYLSIQIESNFLLAVGVFSAYFVITGKRYLYLIDRRHQAHPQWYDWLLSLMMLLVSFGFIYLGWQEYARGNSFGIVSIVFAILALVFSIQDVLVFMGRLHSPILRLRLHLGRMIASFIAAVTAFIVAGLDLFTVYAWLMPTLVGVPIIVFWLRKLKGRTSKA